MKLAIKKPYLFDFKLGGNDQVGFLSVAEYAESIPFEFNRVYWVYDTPENISRGNAANFSSKYALVCVHGSALVHIEDLAQNTYHFELNSPNQGLYVPNKTWRRITLSPESIMICLASEKYDERDYIRDFKDFLSLKKKS